VIEELEYREVCITLEGRAARGILVVMERLCVLYSIHILVVILYYTFARYYHWEKLAKGRGFTGSLCIISYNCMPVYNYLKIKL